MVVLIPKRVGKYFQGIGLVGSLWKFTTGIINRNLTTDIKCNNSLHGFWTGRGVGTATLEDKLLHKLKSMKEAVLHTIFLDLQKAYNALDWYRCLNILEVYGVGIQTLQLLQTCWIRLRMVENYGGYFAPPPSRYTMG